MFFPTPMCGPIARYGGLQAMAGRRTEHIHGFPLRSALLIWNRNENEKMITVAHTH